MNSPAGQAPVDARVTELAPPDHTYLHMDKAGAPMHWSMILQLEGGGDVLGLDAVRERVRERSGLFEIFRLGIRNGRWRKPEVVLADDSWDAGEHVTELGFTDRAHLQRRVAKLLESPLPRPRPFWDITLFTPSAGAEGVGQWVLLRVHHSVSDGIAGAAFAALLADGEPEDLAEFERFATSPRFRISGIDPEELAEAKAAYGDQHAAGGGKKRAWPALTKSGEREYALVDASTRDLRKAAKRNDATVHEFLLAAIGRAISLNPPTSPQADVVRVTLPVTLDDGFRHTGNAVSVALLNLLGNEPDLTRQIDRARSELETIARRKPELYLAAADDLPRAPLWGLQRAIVNASMSHMHPDIHIGINPGFSRVRSVLGQSIVTLTPLSPLAGYSLSVTTLILGHTTTFGVVTDAQALPGYADRFVATLGEVLREALPST
ncbi:MULTISPECIES: wax ester/triacylglycerol synthase domain-containing protein [Gordonia]|uniref:Diacylglycerol O-acyltransferase n=2 Tax=Gordonia terrae TaxID=2055 RepID=A0A2I1R5K1_9ACTN|nr:MULTISPECIES: wax ester/triacylglycerol synthase domain-containing protein [Gordonia]VTR09305.1 Probable diacyglycerol O-acyltransferase tgs1 [Clostridioides difficile]ANY21959.1 diacylglycerol O-acyltransferase [Gordonia terrae]AWO82700.1 diacylglycerol O-acyltransferase [Gordonia terrae]MCG7632989.1 wax ester/triacylglycerol synthase family O-acyltransferase [Gordonia sp. McavH-238-E]PKZ64410.1 diacylglycerol O-acyltransferase [Gordonia terrae]